MSKFILSIFLIISSASLFAQKKYQGLLWEITGNGMEEPSYLYGTMHVSNKLAFNVSDSFYHCLNAVDAVALESSPESWMEEYRDMGGLPNAYYDYGNNFYKKAFKITQPYSDAIYNLLENKNSLMNQILYRFSPGSEDYQENTYLDMFIFQAGAKNGKPVHSLETFEEVMELSVLSMTPDKNKVKDNGYNSYLENNSENRFVLLEEAYRRGDLDQIDSISKSNNPTKVYHKYFIVERNKNMVRRLDSIMQTQSVFTGIGAAHLPGKEGAIELLRNLGYKVRPVSRKSSGKSHKMRKKLEELYYEVEFEQTTTTDGFINVDVPGVLYEMPSNQRGRMEYLCPEPINGGYFSVVRLFTYGPIFNRSPEYYRETFDSLDYMATPGDIIKKEAITNAGHIGYNIVSQSSNGSLNQYHIYFTATEILVFKGSGIGEYIEKSEPHTFFSKISLQPNSSEWVDVSPVYGGAKWKMKGVITGQDMIEGMDDTEIHPIYQSYDKENGEYYQVMRYHLDDLDYIEEDSFDLYYLGKTYGDNLGYEVVDSKYEHNGKYAFVTQRLTQNKDTKGQAEQINLKILTRGGLYYLMATTASGGNHTQFFKSFEFTPYITNDEYEVMEDTNLFFTVNTIKKDEGFDYASMYGAFGYGYYDEEDEDKSYLDETKQYQHFNHKQSESIWVGYRKYHNYEGWDSLSEYWNHRIERLAKVNGFIVTRRKQGKKNGDHTLDFMFSDTGSTKGILTHMRLHHGVVYTLQSLIDTIKGPSDYVSTFFESFEPMDTLIGRDIFEDKGQVFLEHCFGTDSLKKVHAMKSVNKINFKDKDVPGIIKLYNEYDYDEEDETIEREDLIMTLGNREVEEAYNFLYGVYDSNNFKSDLQFIVLKCFSYTESEEAYDAIYKLLMENTPFTEKNNKLNFFNNLYDSLELSTDYFPGLLELVVYPEYKPYVVEMLAHGFLNNFYTFDHFVSKKNIIFRDAYIELKRTVANQQEEGKKDNYYNNSQTNEYHSLFLDYYALMCAFKKNGHDTQKFFKDIYRITDKKFIVEAQIIHHLLGLPVDTAAINKVAQDIKYRVWVYNRLDDQNMLDLFDDSINQEDMAFALLYNYGYDEEKDSVVFLKKIKVDNGKDEGYVYFFKRKQEKVKYWVIDYIGLQPLDEGKHETYSQDYKKGLSVRNEEEIEMTIDKTIEIFQMKPRKRVVVTGYDWGNWGGLY